MHGIRTKISALNKCSVKNTACNADDELIQLPLHSKYL